MYVWLCVQVQKHTCLKQKSAFWNETNTDIPSYSMPDNVYATTVAQLLQQHTLRALDELESCFMQTTKKKVTIFVTLKNQ
jgi:hypothetical protein